jgi:hypothetical protein
MNDCGEFKQGATSCRDDVGGPKNRLCMAGIDWWSSSVHDGMVADVDNDHCRTLLWKTQVK